MKVPATNTQAPSPGNMINLPMNIPQHLRKAAGSKKPDVLPSFIKTHSITLSDLDDTTYDGRGALHMAAWTGAVENVILLLEMGCNINAIATKKHAYGKTPIFFAATRSRTDVMNLLLDHNANVRIVNNKGQSVQSIAASHFAPEMVERILQLEKQQQIQNGLAPDSLEGWVDYKKSHPDGCVYGDLDLRFIDRPLTDEDVVKDLVVNPTTKQSRKGNFARNNPHLARHQETEQDQKKRLPPTPDFISEEEVHKLEKLWSQVRRDLRDNDSWNVFSTLLSIVQLFDEKKMNSSWAVDCAARLKLEAIMCHIEPNINSENESTVTVVSDVSSILSEATIFCGNGDRFAVLVKRILTKARETTEIGSTSLTTYETIQIDHFWSEAEEHLNNESFDEMFLSLNKIVILMDTKSGPWMFDLAKRLHTLLESSNVSADRTKENLGSLCNKSDNRQSTLLRKLLSKSIEEDDISREKAQPITTTKKKKKHNHSLPAHYKHTIQVLQNIPNNLLSWDILMNDCVSSESSSEQFHLSLPTRPIFVDSCEKLNELRSKLYAIAERTNSGPNLSLDQFVAFDTEWYTSPTASTSLATIQLSILEEGIPSSWVVDLIYADDTQIHSTTCDLLRWLFVESDVSLIGFAYKHDLHMLSNFIGQEIDISPRYLDLQLLAVHEMMEEEDISSLPGLKSSCDHFLKLNTDKDWGCYSLSKQEQCSEWGRRPLTQSQLNYAGLDAGVLLVLMADIVRKRL